MKFYSFLLAVLLVPGAFLVAQDAKKPEDKEAAYTRTITSRSEKIVAALGLASEEKKARVTDIITHQYRNLNAIHTTRDEAIKAAKANATDKAAADARVKVLEDEAAAKLENLHTRFLGQLAAELTPDQITGVKDGLTYGVVSVTYKGYTDMIPTLKEAEKEQIMAWLVEAREHAMDAGSSEKKHGWFGKYKGRINNYLSAAGYDIRKEREAWEKRQSAAKVTSGN